jgi:ABC-type transport system involved in cytochrome c biogenesis ATPase subunit
MRLKWIQLQNYRSYDDSGIIAIGNITVFVGRNNSGKSALIRGIAQLQADITNTEDNDVRKGVTAGIVTAQIEDINYDTHFLGQSHPNFLEGKLVHTIRKPKGGDVSSVIQIMSTENGNMHNIGRINSIEPNNFIYPYLAKRKVVSYDRSVDLVKTTSVTPNLIHLTSKIQRLANESHPKAYEYKELCEKVLGYKVSAHAAPGGQQSGIHIGDFDYIPIEDMGEGVPNLLGLITMLCVAKNKLFLIEELENDVHPEALKALLDVIVEKSTTNQFIVSTHSNIVVKWLASAPESKLYSIALDPYIPGAVPNSKITEVGASTEARVKVLEELGYELSDFDLWDGWLFLEESSAERIIRDYLIRLYAPKLARARTLATNGTGRLKTRFDDFNRLFVFTHLTSRYINKAWVIADGNSAADTSGTDAVEALKDMYCRKPDSRWNEANFSTWAKHDFEEYYPTHFAQRIIDTLAIGDAQAKRNAKKILLDEVMAWCDTQTDENLRSIRCFCR